VTIAYRTGHSTANTMCVGRASLGRLGLVARIVALGGAAFTAGCVHPQDVNEVEFDPTPPATPEATVMRDVVIGGDDDDANETPPPAPATLVWSNVRVNQREPVLFRLGAGLGALGHIDLNPCRGQGLPAGYVHMHLTFRGTGHVVRAAVETPIVPPPEALECIGDQVEATMVPTFDGGDVNLSKSFFVN
jgi:hypothetical protein